MLSSRPVSILLAIVAILALGLLPHAQGSAIKPTVQDIGNGTHIISTPADWYKQRTKAYEQGRTKISPFPLPPAFKEPPNVPARNCMTCLPGRSECFDMCENQTDRYQACPNCRTCYNPDSPKDLARCTEDFCRNRGAFNDCMLDLGKSAVKQCARIDDIGVVLECAAAATGLLAFGGYSVCYFQHCL